MQRAFYLVYATLSYLLFFATFLYLIGFVGDLPLLPRTIDQGGQAGLATAVAVNLVLISLFGIQHSVMARQSFKAAWTRIVPKPIERSTYVLFSSAALIILFAFWQPIPLTIWQVDQPLAAATLWAVFGLGWGIVLLSTFLINHFELFGLQQVYLHARNHQPSAPRFRTPFLYRIVRHPLYSGFLIAFWATPHMTLGHLMFALGMTGYILIALVHEERDLVGLFGDDYRGYQASVGKLAPRLGRASRARAPAE